MQSHALKKKDKQGYTQLFNNIGLTIKDMLYVALTLLYGCIYQCYSTAKYFLHLDEQTLRP